MFRSDSLIDFFFFQAEDGIRDDLVTGVQTCALPILSIFVVAAYSRGNIWRMLKHPMLVGVKTWAVAHLISNGDLGSIVLFASFLVWAGYDRITLKYRTDPGAPAIPVGGHRNDTISILR